MFFSNIISKSTQVPGISQDIHYTTRQSLKKLTLDDASVLAGKEKLTGAPDKEFSIQWWRQVGKMHRVDSGYFA